MSKVGIQAYGRSPTGRLLGVLAPLTAAQLAGQVIAGVVQKAAHASPTPSTFDEVILGNVIGAGLGQNIARSAARAGGISDTVPAFTVSEVCGSGLRAVREGYRAILAGDTVQVLCGGVESMSNAPHLLPNLRSGKKYGSTELIDAIESDGLRCLKTSRLMGEYADAVAAKFKITREQADHFAWRSHQKATVARDGGNFKSEIIPIQTPKAIITADETIRDDTTLEKLAALKPAFATGTGGGPPAITTAGNAPGLSDGAAAVVLSHDLAACNWVIVGMASHAMAPEDLFEAPIFAIRKLLKKLGWQVSSVNIFEINEAFATQTLVTQKELAIADTQLNPFGGAIALGHPLGASGARVLCTLLNGLTLSAGRRGIAALCLGGGGAIAAAIEKRA
ncbi:MAG TPA: thiolase family protein [Planctomycetota bacterium]|nr:thiolase family protein [Planctomycetota bacterium]